MRLKGKFRLRKYFSKRATYIEKKICNVFRQYFSLPLLRPIHAEVNRLGGELQDLVKHVGKADARHCNYFPNDFVRFWCKMIGPSSFTVFGLAHTTNNRLERYVTMLIFPLCKC